MCDGDGPTHFRADLVKARKPYKCCECYQPIEVGELHEMHTGIWEGWDTFRTCLACAEARAELRLECFTYGELRADLAYECESAARRAAA